MQVLTSPLPSPDEVGAGSPGAFDGKIEEMIAIDIAPQAPGQISGEHAVSLRVLAAYLASPFSPPRR